jgi:outer membrane receptor protein involved in Fe transport
MRLSYFAALAAAVLLLPAAAHAQNADTLFMRHDPAKYQILVSATKTNKRAIEVPNAATVVSGAELRRSGARTLGEALIDVVGIDTGGGSDNGSRLPNIGLWGLKEFDALLITVDGVPVGGPFNPSLVQIAVDDIDRIEIVKGPQGSLYGVSAFAGMIQVFTDREAKERGTVSVGGGSFGDLHGRLGLHRQIDENWRFDVALSGLRDDGFQDRTSSEQERGRISVNGKTGKTTIGFDLTGLADRNDWGTPIPYDAGEPLPGFQTDKNYAVQGAVLEHRVVGSSLRLGFPVNDRIRVENTLSATRDRQNSVRSFPADFLGDTLGSAGVAIRPVETVLFNDLRAVSDIELAGHHQWVTGAALTWGRTKSTGIGFDIEELLSDPSTIPTLAGTPVGDNRSFEDRRTFFGVYAHDDWTLNKVLSLSGGGRWDHTNEKLHAFGQEVGGDAAVADDAKTSEAWSGDIAALAHLLPEPKGNIDAFNVYANWKSSFKPAAPNLTEAENAKILDPERTHSVEAGVKTQMFSRQLSVDAHVFQLDFHNLVVSNLDVNSNPVFLNAGHERFKGYEVQASVSPNSIAGLTISGGYAHHDPRFVQFTFVTPDGQFRDVAGKLIELAPQELYNGRISYAPAKWLGGWAAIRHTGIRALNRRNKFFDEAFDEYDAGLSFEAPIARLTVAGRNLGDSRHIVAESDIGDSQFYISAPRRFTAEITLPF